MILFHASKPLPTQIKCKNFLATLLRLASDQPESVARNVRGLIQVRRDCNMFERSSNASLCEGPDRWARRTRAFHNQITEGAQLIPPGGQYHHLKKMPRKRLSCPQN